MIGMKPLLHKISNSYRKNKDDLRALLLGGYPQFVFRNLDRLPQDQIPIFTFHGVSAGYFEAQLRYLAENGYRTLDGDELHALMVGKTKAARNGVVLTFDDGRSSLWSTAYPLLKKYGLRAIAFILPGHIAEGSVYWPSLEDVWAGRVGLEEVEQREPVAPLCSWREIQQMQSSGVIDFQSHTSYHHSVFVKDRLVDFINPSFQASYLTSTLYPAIRREGRDVFPESLELGFPIYAWAPAMTAARRYLEDEELSTACTSFVDQNGGPAFFEQGGWRKMLKNFSDDYSKQNGNSGRFLTFQERAAEVRRDLAESKTVIEARLGKPVQHLCYPWYAGSEIAVQISKEVGYSCNYWGILGRRAVNRIGGDPYHLARMNDNYIYSLPGKGRTALYELLIQKMNSVVYADSPPYG
ncbi:MAG TPA: polysaccharide deacetylase family protein [Anaerolineales bacterium]